MFAKNKVGYKSPMIIKNVIKKIRTPDCLNSELKRGKQDDIGK